MLWILLAAGAALMYALHGAWAKEVSGRSGPLVAAWALFAFALPFVALYFGVQGVPQVGPRFWPVVAANGALYLVSFTLFLSALREGGLGVTYPLLALTPVFVIPVEWVLLRELPGARGMAGVALIAAGIYLIHFGERSRGILGPLAALLRNPGARRALAVALLWSVNGTLDRVAVLDASPALYGTVLFGVLSLLFLPVILVRDRWLGTGAEGETRPGRDPQPFVRALGRSGGWRLALHGFLFAAMFVLQMEALELALASYVLSIKRTGAIPAVLLGWMAFREEGLRYRLPAAVVTLAGVSLLVLSG